MISIDLDDLSKNFDDIETVYIDIANYEVARENICSYIFLLARKLENACVSEKILIETDISKLTFIRDNLKIADRTNVNKVLNEIIPLYIAERAVS